MMLALRCIVLPFEYLSYIALRFKAILIFLLLAICKTNALSLSHITYTALLPLLSTPNLLMKTTLQIYKNSGIQMNRSGEGLHNPEQNRTSVFMVKKHIFYVRYQQCLESIISSTCSDNTSN